MDLRPRKGDPLFRDVWRKFAQRVHPDLFSRWPDLATHNGDALQRLQGILNEAKSGDKSAEDFMQPRTEDLVFYVRTAEDSTFMRVPLRLRIAGGHCPDSLAAALAPMLQACGLPHRFFWGRDYWETRHMVRDAPPPEEGEDGGDGGRGADADGGSAGGDPRRQQKKWS